jgi:hypothetical protein
LRGRRAAAILTGQNIDRGWMQIVLAGETPQVSEQVGGQVGEAALHESIE